MKVVLLGATGMVGQGVLRECLRDPGVEQACFYCLGVSAVGLSEATYRRVTYDLTLTVARALVERNPQMTFVYVSGTGTDSSETGRAMWARVKGATENALGALPFRATFMFRPGFIQPLHGIRSNTGWYRAMYAALEPLYPLFRTLFPAYVTDTDRVGRAMLAVVRHGAPAQVLENRDINELAQPLGA